MRGNRLQGINMPARTCVFMHDSIYLNPLTFHQMAGRAGRRGFDLCGDIIFVGFRAERIAALAAARIPGAHGNFVMTLPLALSTAALLTASLKNSKDHIAVGVKCLLNYPLASAAGHSDLQPLLTHYFLFALTLLRERGLLDAAFAPQGLAPLVERLDYYPNAAGLFLVDLLQTGALEWSVRNLPKEAAAASILSTLAHLFNRNPLVKQTRLQGEARTELPALPEYVAAVVRGANAATLSRLVSYLAHYSASTEMRVPALAFSRFSQDSWGMQGTPSSGSCGAALISSGALVRVTVRSALFALRGAGDAFSTFTELRDTVAEHLEVRGSALMISSLCQAAHVRQSFGPSDL
jgi:ATP-dependent RNA helicase DDX60